MLGDGLDELFTVADTHAEPHGIVASGHRYTAKQIVVQEIDTSVVPDVENATIEEEPEQRDSEGRSTAKTNDASMSPERGTTIDDDLQLEDSEEKRPDIRLPSPTRAPAMKRVSFDEDA